MAKEPTPPDRYCVTINEAYAGLYPSLVVGTPYPVNNTHPKYGEGFWLERTSDPVTWVRASVEHVIPAGPTIHERFDDCARAVDDLADAPMKPAKSGERRTRRRKKSV